MHEQEYTDEREFEVDGERFRVSRRFGTTATFDYIWLSGPNKGYGFTSASSSPPERPESEHVRRIKEFLAEIDPRTGYMGDD